MGKRFSSFLEYLHLLWVNVAFQWYSFFEYIKVIFYYYRRSWYFAKSDSALLLYYLYDSPFEISKQFMIERGEKDIFVYGETPLTSLDEMSQACGITARDTVFELGCGRARTCFWLRQFIGCQVVGIEYIPQFIDRANEIAKRFDWQGIKFVYQDMLYTDLNEATFIYLFGTDLEGPFIKALIKRFKKLRPGTKIATVSYSLNEYDTSNSFQLLQTIPITFSWGETDLYLHQIKGIGQ